MTVENRESDLLQRRPGPSYKWWVVGMLWFICFFNYADRMAITAVTPVLQKQYGFNNSQIGYIVSAFMLVYALSSPFAGQIGDKIRRKSLIIGGLVVWSAVTWATGFCHQLWQFVTVRASEGLGETFYFPATMSLISDYHAKKTRSMAMGLHQTGVYAGTIGGSALAGYLAMHYTWQTPFWFFGIGGVLLGIVLATFLREPARNEAERLELETIDPLAERTPEPEAIPIAQYVSELLHTPSLLLLMAAFFGANSVAMIFLSWMPKYLNDHFGMDLFMAGFSATFYLQVASIVGSILGGALADRARRRTPGGRMLTQAIGACAGIPFIYLAGATTQSFWIVVYLGGFGLAKGIYDSNIWASMYDVVDPSRRATTLGLANMIGWIGGACGTAGIGIATDRLGVTMGQALGSTAFVYAVVALVLILAGAVFAPRDIRHAGAKDAAPEIFSH